MLELVERETEDNCEQRPSPPNGSWVPPQVGELVADLRLLRERGMVRIRHTELPSLRTAASHAAPSAAAEPGPRAVEALLRAAVDNLGGGQLAAAAAHTFGLTRGGRDRQAQQRRQRAAQEYGVSVERFRKHHERLVIEQVAEEILELCQAAARPAGPPRPQSDAGPAQLAAEIWTEARWGNVRCPVIVHVEPVELLRNVDVVVAPANTYLELPQPYKASVSAALRRAAARRGPDGAILVDELLTGLRSWVSTHGRAGMPVAAGTVAVTTAGALSEQGIRRIYHAAVAAPRPGTNDYDVLPTSVAQAVRAVFATARAERGLFTPPLHSIGLPLLGAGRGGLDPAVSLTWTWAALERELRADNTWEVHFITRRRATAELIISRISHPGGSCRGA